MKVTVIELKGNELGWLIKLAEMGFERKKFQEFLKDKEKLRRFLIKVLGQFHPNFFYPGTSKVAWTLISRPETSETLNLIGHQDIINKIEVEN